LSGRILKNFGEVQPHEIIFNFIRIYFFHCNCFQGGGNIMPTISSMVQRNDMIANVSYRYFKLDSEAAEKSVLVNAPIKTNVDFLKSDFGGQPALTNLVENYSADREDFQSKIQDKLDSLQESSEKLKDSVQEDSETSSATAADDKKTSSNLATLGEFAKDNVPPRAKILTFQPKQEKADSDKTSEVTDQLEKVRERKAEEKAQRDRIVEFAENYLVAEQEDEEDGIFSETPKTSEENTVERVQNIVRNYNSVVSYLNENRDMSNRMSALASNFNTGEVLQNSLSSIGINENAAGELTVDTQQLLNALEENPDRVISLLGSTGLTGQLDRNVSLANHQGDNLFPTLDEYAGEEQFQQWEYLYAARDTSTANYAQERSRKFLNMFT